MFFDPSVILPTYEGIGRLVDEADAASFCGTKTIYARKPAFRTDAGRKLTE